MKMPNSSAWLPYALTAVIVFVVTVMLIYLTPLKHIQLTPPTMNEWDPKAFLTEFTAHPDKYILVDVRSPNIYASAHAKGAINIPIENLYDDRGALPRSGKQIALICTTGRLAAVAYGYLESQGFTNLIHIEGGMVNWAAEGLPVEGKNLGSAKFPDEPDSHQ